MLVGNIEYGSWKDGSSIYKDSKGYYIIAFSNINNKEYKKYIKNWKPGKNNRLLYLDKKTKKWAFTNPKNKITKKKYNRKLTKYQTRPSPPYPANDYCGKTMKGNDGNKYLSKPNKNGICSWKLKSVK